MEFCENDMIYMELDVTTHGASSYLWQNGSISPVHIVEQQGIYSVTVSNLCMSVSDTISIKTKDCSDVLEIWISDAFTPNRDGVNDHFLPIFSNPEKVVYYHLRIFNRWGQLLFHSNHPETGWDGGYSQEGVYTYLIEYKLSGEKNKRRQGTVMLLR